MSKEYLDALERLGKLYLPENYNKLQVNEIGEFSIVKEALQRLESIDNAKPSKALNCLEEMAKNRIEYSEYSMPIKDISEYKTIKQALLKAQEQEKEIDRLENQCLDVLGDNIRLKNKSQEQKKVLDIIKEKNVDIKGLIESTNVEEYNRKYSTYERTIYCRNLGTPYCNKDFGVKGWIGCNKTKLTQEEFELLKRYCGRKESE